MNPLAGLLAFAGEHLELTGDGISVGGISGLALVSAEIHLPSGDRYRVTVEWLGDREVRGA